MASTKSKTSKAAAAPIAEAPKEVAPEVVDAPAAASAEGAAGSPAAEMSAADRLAAIEEHLKALKKAFKSISKVADKANKRKRAKMEKKAADAADAIVLTEAQQAIYTKLQEARKAVAAAKNRPVFLVCNNKVLQKLATGKPKKIEELSSQLTPKQTEVADALFAEIKKAY